MARHRIPTTSRDVVPASRQEATVDTFLASGRGVTTARRRSAGIAAGALDRVAGDLDGYMRTGDWSGARALHFVALYAYLHERVYGVAPIMTSEDRRQACFVVAQAMKTHFDADPGAVADFMLWVWRRERGGVEWRKKNGRQTTFRIGWRYQFGGHLVTDYLVAMRGDEDGPG